MSVVEAAAFGAPSVVQSGGDAVGATALLGSAGCIELDLASSTLEALCETLLTTLDDAPALAATAAAAKERALSWGEEAAGKQLSSIVMGARAAGEAQSKRKREADEEVNGKRPR